MGEITTIGLDIAKNVFQLHGVDGVGSGRGRNDTLREILLYRSRKG